MNRSRLFVESLEDRRVLSTLTVVPHGFTTDALHFRSLDAAVAAAAVNDTVQVEPGADAPVFNSSTLSANANAGDTQITTDGLIAPGQLVLIANNEIKLIDAAVPAAGFKFTLTLHTPLNNAHTAGDPVDARQEVGIGKKLTILGDINAAPVSVPDLEVLGGTDGVTLVNLKASNVTLGSSQNQVASCTIHSLGEGGSQEVISGNRLGGLFLRSPAGSTNDHDQVLNNTITGMVGVIAENGALIKGNTVTVLQSDGFSEAIGVRMSDNITLANNDVTFVVNKVSPPDYGMAVLVEDGGVPVHVNLLNNNIGTEGNGLGIFTYAVDGSKLFVKIEGNDLRANRVGLYALGDSSTNATAAGTIDAGGGTLGSLGGNNFRGFTNAPGNLNAGLFAIYLTNQGQNAGTITAHQNIWSVSDPNTVVKDFDSNHLTGGQPYGDGTIDVGAAQLDADHQYVQTLYHDFLGRAASPSDLDAWVSLLPSIGRQGVANALVRSTESLTDFVDHLYLTFLNRTADVAGEANAVNFLQHGGTEEQLVAALLNSPEYYNHASAVGSSNHPDANWLASLYQQLLGRPGSATEINAWLAALPSMGRTVIASSFLTSPEYRTDQVLQFYTHLLHRASPPPAADVTTVVNSSSDLLTIEVGFAAGQDFYTNG